MKWTYLNPLMWICLFVELIAFLIENGFQGAIDFMEKSK